MPLSAADIADVRAGTWRIDGCTNEGLAGHHQVTLTTETFSIALAGVVLPGTQRNLRLHQYTVELLARTSVRTVRAASAPASKISSVRPPRTVWMAFQGGPAAEVTTTGWEIPLAWAVSAGFYTQHPRNMGMRQARSAVHLHLKNARTSAPATTAVAAQ